MDDKKELLKQIGWTDELIEKCLSPDIYTTVQRVSFNKMFVVSDRNITDFILTLDNSLISDGSQLTK